MWFYNRLAMVIFAWKIWQCQIMYLISYQYLLEYIVAFDIKISMTKPEKSSALDILLSLPIEQKRQYTFLRDVINSL